MNYPAQNRTNFVTSTRHGNLAKSVRFLCSARVHRLNEERCLTPCYRRQHDHRRFIDLFQITCQQPVFGLLRRFEVCNPLVKRLRNTDQYPRGYSHEFDVRKFDEMVISAFSHEPTDQKWREPGRH